MPDIEDQVENNIATLNIASNVIYSNTAMAITNKRKIGNMETGMYFLFVISVLGLGMSLYALMKIDKINV